MPEPITPMLGDIELRSIQNIATVERRDLVEHRVPGMAGSTFQNMGRAATCVKLVGVLFGEEAKTNLETLRGKFHDGEPLSFTADITTATEITDVLIEDFHVVEAAGRPNTFVYEIVLRESPPPPPPADPLGGVEAGILGDAQGLFDQAVGVSDVLDTLASAPDFGDPTEPLSSILDGVSEVTSGLGESAQQLADLFAEPDE